MRRLELLTTTIIGVSLSIGLLNCSSGKADCFADENCDPSGADGGDGGGPDAPAGCDLSLEPKDAQQCVDDAVGVFVDAAGSDTSAGTKTAPVKSITAALGKLGGKSRIYICGEGPFTEHVKLTSAVSLYGGFACGAWTYAGTKAKVAPTDAGYALELANVSSSVIVSDIAFEAAAGTKDKLSSIAVFVSKSTARFVRVSATASEGHDGASGTTGSNYDTTLTASNVLLRGHSTANTMGAEEQECLSLCTNNVHAKGGKGGQGTMTPGPGDPGTPNRGGGAGGLVGGNCRGTGTGGSGNPAPPGVNAVAGTTRGTIAETGWVPTDGPAGLIAEPGQGGGGGGGAADRDFGAGGGGGCGGCGGGPGSTAQGGGGSIAFLAFESVVTLRDAALTSARAGNGGAGAAGQDGQNGGSGGNPSSGGCQGGKGGKGGKGGASAGGAGGISAAILYKGSKPTVEGSTLKPGTEGTKGPGGVVGTNDGPDGNAAETIEAP